MIGTSLGQYDVEALLGEGGMGRVFRARDTRLGRAVAIEVLPDAFRADAERAARFEREAKLRHAQSSSYRRSLRIRGATAGGTAVMLAAVRNPFGLSWQGSDIFIGQGDQGILRIAGGGTPQTIVQAAPGEVIYGPQLLPGGEWLLFTVTTATGQERWDKAKVVAQGSPALPSQFHGLVCSASTGHAGETSRAHPMAA